MILNKIKKEALKKGYKTRSDQFDYLINKLMFEYKIDPQIMD